MTKQSGCAKGEAVVPKPHQSGRFDLTNGVSRWA